MGLVLLSCWRAARDSLRPRVLLLSLLPLALTAVACGLLGWLWGADAVALARRGLEAVPPVARGLAWLQQGGAGDAQGFLALLLVAAIAVPAVAVLSLLAVALAMTPALTGLVAARQFPALERKQGANVWQSLGWSLAATLGALLAFLVSLPLWFIPPLVLVLPPLIWGWLTYRVMAFDALAVHASVAERQALFSRYRLPLLAMGVACGYLGAVPALAWASHLLFAAGFVVLAPLALWLYTLVFAFSSLWFLHYALAALERLRASQPGLPPPVARNG